jgi:hypothetical protein
MVLNGKRKRRGEIADRLGADESQALLSVIRSAADTTCSSAISLSISGQIVNAVIDPATHTLMI